MVCGAILGFFAAPCALGSVAIAGALRTQSPLAAFGFLAVAGVLDLRIWFHPHRHAVAKDGLAYILLTVAALLIASEHGATLVHPRIAIALGISSLAAAGFAVARRTAINGSARWIPAIMLAALVIGAPQPAYHGTETNLSDAFAGERVDFTGQFLRSNGSATLVRYAITCCRADAQPVAIALDGRIRAPNRAWVHAQGVLRAGPAGLYLAPQRYAIETPPLDPFVYR